MRRVAHGEPKSNERMSQESSPWLFCLLSWWKVVAERLRKADADFDLANHLLAEGEASRMPSPSIPDRMQRSSR